MVCGSRMKSQCGIFLHNLVDRNADLVLVGACLGLDRERDRGFGQLRGLVVDRSSLVAQRFAGRRFFQLSDRTDVTGVQFRDLVELFSLHHLRVLKALQACPRL